MPHPSAHIRICSRLTASLTRLRLLVLLLLPALATVEALAQADAQFAQYFEVPNYYNAGAIGTTDLLKIRGGMRMQWVGISKAPRTFLVAADMPFKFLGKRFGVGLVMQQESMGLYKNMNLGAQIGFVDQSFKGSEVYIPDDDDYHESSDEAIPESDIHGNAFDVGFGLMYTHKWFWAGISATHLNQPPISLGTDQASEQSYEAKVKRAFYFMAGSNIPLKNTLFELQPSVLVRNSNGFTQADITMRVMYNKFLSGGIAYRTSDAISLMLGAEIKNFFVGYAYDYALSAINKASSGSHEFFVGYNLKLNLGDKNKNKHKSIRIM